MFAGIVAFALEHWTWGAALAAPLAYLTPAGPILVFLKANWKWALPSLIAAVAVVYAGTQRINYLECKSDRAEAVARAEAKVRTALEADAKFSNRLVGEYAAEIATLQGSLQDALVNQSRAPRTPACDRTPAADAYDRGLELLDRGSAAPGQPDPAGNPGGAVPAQAPAKRLPK